MCKYLPLCPELGALLKEYRQLGANPIFHGDQPQAPSVRGFPHAQDQTVQIIEKMWKDLRAGRTLIFTGISIDADIPVILTPSPPAPKKFPDRTSATDARFIEELGYGNYFLSGR